MMHYSETIIGIIQDHDVKNIIFTGHSLGAGLAQIAMMNDLYLKRYDNNTNLGNINFAYKAFESPMVFFSFEENELDQASKDFLREFQSFSLI